MTRKTSQAQRDYTPLTKNLACSWTTTQFFGVVGVRPLSRPFLAVLWRRHRHRPRAPPAGQPGQPVQVHSMLEYSNWKTKKADEDGGVNCWAITILSSQLDTRWTLKPSFTLCSIKHTRRPLIIHQKLISYVVIDINNFEYAFLGSTLSCCV